MPEIEIPINARNPSKFNILSPLVPIFLDSLKIIFLENPKFFITIFIFITLPLSLLLTSFSVSSTPRFLKSHIARLEWLSKVVPIWIEAANIKEESRADTQTLFRIKLLHGIPILALSLFAAVAIVVAAYTALRRKKKVTFRVAVDAVRARWVPPLLTCMVNFIVWVGWAHLDPLVNTYAVKFGYLTAVVQVVVEVYMMAVLGLGLVVSVVEGRVGLDAIRAGSGLMKGRRVCGWVLSGLILLISGFIGRQMVGVLNGQDMGVSSGGYTWTVGIRFGSMVGLLVLLGWFVLWSYVVFTVLYVECRKGHAHAIREEDKLDIDEIDI